MIPLLASPSVCVIDDEEKDYRPILDALLGLGIACVHIRGDSEAPLPPEPLKGLRIVFTDLHLANSVGKGAAAHTANVFRKVVSSETAPLVVVIWSKYANDPVTVGELPPEDQPTETDLFKQALLEAEPRFKDRLIFVNLPKLKSPDRPAADAWIETLKSDIQTALQGLEACEVLWCWESLVRDAGLSVTEELTNLALADCTAGSGKFHDNLKLTLRLLAKEQGGPDCSAHTAPRHLAAVLAQSLVDRLEHSPELKKLATHGAWIADKSKIPSTNLCAPKLNGVFLTSASSLNGRAFPPGAVYRITQPDKFKDAFGEDLKELSRACYAKVEDGSVWTKEEWQTKVVPVLVELSPACDFHQGTRRQALLMAGVIGPIAGRKHARTSDAYQCLPSFSLRWPIEHFPEQDVFLVFCSRYKMTMPPDKHPEWLAPWFRLRELPTASLRNWHSSHASRVGYVSLQ